MKELQRIKVGDFSITNAININEILENKNLKQIYRIYNSDKFIGLGIVENELLKRDIVL